MQKRNIFTLEMNAFCSQNKYFPRVICALLLTGCGASADQNGEEDQGADSTMYSFPIGAPLNKEFTSVTGKTWIVRQTPMSDLTLVNLSVQVRGFAKDSIAVEFGEIDPVIAIHQADLDKDGFEEIYLVTQSTDPEAFGTVFGLSSNQDTSVSMISFEGATLYNTKEGEPYAGYQGKDAFLIKDGVLINTFPFSSEDGSGQGHRSVVYELVKGEASMQLLPKKKN